jgi:hypothetical protein
VDIEKQESLKKASLEELKAVVGEKLALTIKENL